MRLAFMPTGTNRLSRKAEGNNNAKNIQSRRDFILAFKLQPRGGSTAKRPYSIHFWAGARSLGRNHTRGNRRTSRSSLQKPTNNKTNLQNRPASVASDLKRLQKEMESLKQQAFHADEDSGELRRVMIALKEKKAQIRKLGQPR